MNAVDLDCSVPDWLIEHPELHGLFEELGIDYSCGGKSLGAACRERGLNASDVLKLCEHRLHESADQKDVRAKEPPGNLD